MEPKSPTARQQDAVHVNPAVTRSHAMLSLEVEVLEERIAPAYLGAKPLAPCCAGR